MKTATAVLMFPTATMATAEAARAVHGEPTDSFAETEGAFTFYPGTLSGDFHVGGIHFFI